MEKKVDTPYGKMSKIEDLIWGVVVLVFGIGYALARLFFPESKATINSVFLSGVGASLGVFCCIHNLLHALKQKTDLQDEFEEEEFEDVVEDYFHDIDAERQNYKGSWSAVEEWKQKMRERADELKHRIQTEGETEDVLDIWATWDEEMQDGLEAVQNGNNPLLPKKEKKEVTKEEEQQESKKSPWGKKIISLLVLIPLLFLYLVLSILECSIFLLTIAFSCFLFSYDIDPNSSDPFALFDFTKLKRMPFKFKYLVGIIFISVIGYFLNQWTYAQSGEIQLAVTICLPILYGLIYYKLHHKKSIREI
ncbi:MAG: hypothetical protein IKS41_03430 [Alphaproteobacteria bacterium]|nr:hypothetical protein [Alphaproteobacteria bacterium]